MAFRTCAILSVGDEVVAGRIIDTNAPWLASVLHSHGVKCTGMASVSDDPQAIEQAMRQWISRVDVLITTGGLGPTDDDRTRVALCAVSGDDIERDEAAVQSLQTRLKRSRVPVGEHQLRQADRPVSMRSVPNDNGTAPGITGLIDGTAVWVLPGPPDELRPMVESHLMPAMQRNAQGPVPHEDIVAFGLAESAAAQIMGEHLLLHASIAGSIRVSMGLLHMRLEHPDETRLELEANRIRDELGPLALPKGTTTPADAVSQCARARGFTLATAESCTGGGIGAALTHRPGASDIFAGGVVAYANMTKVDVLGVPKALLEPNSPGAVSAEVAAAMAIGARRVVQADAAVSVTGIAGPDGGTTEKPVGTVWIGTVVGNDVRTRQLRLPGRRERVREWTVHAALQSLRWHVEGIDATMHWDVPTETVGDAS